MSAASFHKILIVNPFGIGDAIFSLYLVEALKKSLPQTRIGFLGNERTAALLRMDRSVDIVHEFNRDEFRALRRRDPLGFAAKAFRSMGEIKKERYGALFDLSLGREFAFLAAFLGIGRRIGFDFKGRGLWLTHKTRLEGYETKHVVDWQLGLLRAAGLETPQLSSMLPFVIPPEAKKEAADLLAGQGIPKSVVPLAVAPGGGKSWGPNAVYKQWSPERFSEAVRKSGWHGPVLLLGDAEEKALLDEVKKGLPGAATAAGLPIAAVCALLQQSKALLCNDGGLLHLANALGVPTVSLYGPVDEKVYGPYGRGPRREVLALEIPCRPCYQKFHFPDCAHERRCLEELSVEKVSSALGKI